MAQISSDSIKQFLASFSPSLDDLHYGNLVKEFYRNNGFHTVWFTENSPRNIKALSNYIQNSPELGLRQQDYIPELPVRDSRTFLSPRNEKDSLLAEIKFTDAAIHFFHDVLLGNQPEPVSYNGLNYVPSCHNIPDLLNNYFKNNRFADLLNDVEPKQSEYRAVKNKLIFFREIATALNFKDAVILSKKVSNSNRPLLTRLYQLGIITSDTLSFSEEGLKEKIKTAQSLFSLLGDGVLRGSSLEALNVPLAVRIMELEYTLNTLRWLSCIKQSNHIIVVNIPSATLLLYEHGKIVLESKLIVGKKSTPTPTLCSNINEVILYPYWNVPTKIATQELLPAIKHNPGFLEANSFQVLNNRGRIINPESINWQALSRNNFPYAIRQSTGCDNSLGLVKLNFYNPYSVYLHDTPGKSLFLLNRRYFSHGCMRLEKAIEVTRYILKDNTIAIDTLEEKGCLKNQAPITVPASEIIPVFVLYHTAWVDAAANLSFYEDVYKKLPAIKRSTP
jgi:murein L,D-transpeptidase YcbB/YkuD